jgi:hypothetical protein
VRIRLQHPGNLAEAARCGPLTILTTAIELARSLIPGRRLVSITSKGENDYRLRLINDAKYWGIVPGTNRRQGPWIGAIQMDDSREPDGGWRWVTGEPFLYTYWGPASPNDGKSVHNMHNRIFLHATADHWLSATWGDAGSSNHPIVRAFIVKFDSIVRL